MKLAFAHDAFNRLPSFEAALTSPAHSKENLLRIGEQICALSLQEVVGVTLLHRHYPIRANEYVVRSKFPKASFTYVRSSLPSTAEACAWAVSLETWQPIPVEYDMCPTSRISSLHSVGIQKLAGHIGALGLTPIYGLFYLPALPSVDRELYEITDESLRVSIVSNWRDPAHVNVEFVRSVTSFTFDGGKIHLAANTKCGNCPSCHPQIPVIPQQPYIVHQEDIFGLGIEATYPHLGENVITGDLLDKLHSGVFQKIAE